MPVLPLGCAWILLLALVAFAEPVESLPPSQTDSSVNPLLEAPPSSEIPRGGKRSESKSSKKQKSRPKKSKVPAKELEEEEVPPAPALY